MTESELVERVRELNQDPNIHGIIVQLPFDAANQINSDLIISTVSPSKDVDGLHYINAGHLLHGQLDEAFVPCTPKGCLELIKSTGINIQGKNAVVLGRSKLVGTPMANLLRLSDATVTICHSKTQNLPEICRGADILVVAIGKAKFVRGDWVKHGAVVIDCGINSIETPEKKNKICGDIDYEEVRQVAGHATPVPGGVGPMTVTNLLLNTLQAAKKYYNKYQVDNSWPISYLPLKRQNPVPEDIHIAKSHKPKDIDILANEICLVILNTIFNY